jgi:hypothetical protein
MHYVSSQEPAMTERIVGVALLTLFVLATPLAVGAQTFAGVEVGSLIHDINVDALGRHYYPVRVQRGLNVIVVITGYFRISRSGFGDAYYRWWPHKNEYVSPCGDAGARGRPYAFTIDDRCVPPPAASDFDNHTYVYFMTASTGQLVFQINDNKFDDNEGSLRVRIFNYPGW